MGEFTVQGTVTGRMTGYRSFLREVPRTPGRTDYYERHGLPQPARGGTFFYCPWQRQTRNGAHWDITSCGVRKAGWATGTRFRTEKAYRNHWRRFHQEHAEVSTPYDVGLLGWQDETERFAAAGGLTPAAAASEDLRAQVNEGVRARLGHRHG